MPVGGDFQERIVGYDAREYYLTYESGWPPQRREEYLYRLELLKPLSVDIRVWMPILKTQKRLPTPPRVGYQNTWSELSSLKLALTEACQQSPLPAYRIVAITVFFGNDTLHGDMARRLLPTAPPEKNNEWVFLGYDIADEWMLSSLSNCGINSDGNGVPGLRQLWGPQLNHFHLFDLVDSAIRFKHFSNERVPEHAPFFVYGLWIVP